ncbi:MAG: hypothetical protein IPK19_32320 [Chloroflexi bacterium]|nr:hypothetical protein [Chloroflexota bacterium]
MVTPDPAPFPDLRIVHTDSLHAHEEHDSQRSMPLIERLSTAEFMINPPVVTPLGASRYVILDGANRAHAFQALGYPHILVQVVSYDSGQVELRTWNHIVSDWSADEFRGQLDDLPEVELTNGQHTRALAHVLLRDGRVFAVRSPIQLSSERNAALRRVVSIYQRRATLQRSAELEPDQAWLLYPQAFTLITFPALRPADIITAARSKAFIPPGISRHIVHGRALRVNYPMALLRDTETKLGDKNHALHTWLQARLATRQVRFYAEASYLFDE